MAAKGKNAGVNLARKMVTSWSDDVFSKKTSDDLRLAYGVDTRTADEIIRREKFLRGLNTYDRN